MKTTFSKYNCINDYVSLKIKPKEKPWKDWKNTFQYFRQEKLKLLQSQLTDWFYNNEWYLLKFYFFYFSEQNN